MRSHKHIIREHNSQVRTSCERRDLDECSGGSRGTTCLASDMGICTTIGAVLLELWVIASISSSRSLGSKSRWEWRVVWSGLLDCGRTGGGVLAYGDELVGGEQHVALLAMLEERVERPVRHKLHHDHDRLPRGCDSCSSHTVDHVHILS